MAAAMGFSSFGAQNPSSKKRKYNPHNDAVIDIQESEHHGTGANSGPLGERRALPANADETTAHNEDGDDGADTSDGAAAVGAAGGISSDANADHSGSVGAGIAGLPQRPAPAHGGFAGNQHRRGGAPRQASGGHHANKPWYEDYYDHFSNENPWAKLEEAAGLQPISTWAPTPTSREGALTHAA
ncbi:hypothetical protein A9K55_001913 [Cordyceps militaris]|uniref:Uncharacterized protein n=1 Tax=Cordyceps militaris TaxID=73501 RepID=A0A2H4SS38_CORMI|nr:hypothetical protein A9K55_001913 [Cordyceps militaris]